ncbi:CRISPR-associated helicase Cas3' [Streptomyces sp. NPDC005970]|uniref:CRISPR-associated helicase Cas3' n=1 Tax=Streptomyces sp. NPDC005970 TaxID=3156723 RepID=UPI0033D9A07B
MAAHRVTPSRRTLADVRAKSEPAADPERLTTHSRTVGDTVEQIRERIGSPGVLADVSGFWRWVRDAGLLHDAGKVAEGFQEQLVKNGERWGERHEVLSLAYVDLLATAAGWSEQDRLMIATLVATHHRALFRDGTGGKQSLTEQYNAHTLWEEAFTRRQRQGHEQIQVPKSLHRELLAWFSGVLGIDPPPAGNRTLAECAKSVLSQIVDVWKRPVSPERGLIAVLAQGALTLADHAGSAHVTLHTHLPLPHNYLARLPQPYPHQLQAAATDGHLILIAPTGSGKTEGGLAWADRQITSMPGCPRLIWTLPYRASIDAAARRLATDLDPLPGEERADIGILHGTVAQTLLTQAVDDECPPAAPPEHRPGDAAGSATPTKAMARQARARANAMRLFTQRIRVATPHQLLRGALAGPARSSVLLEQANCAFVLDELHAYDPDTFGRLCASMRLWERLGSRIAVLSATLAPPMVDLIRDTLAPGSVTLHRAPPGTSPDRHRLVLDETPLTDPESIKKLRSWLNEGYSVLAVTNTVATAQHLFSQLAPHVQATRRGEDDALLLHSRFKNRDRATIEQRLLRRHRERRKGDPTHRGGLVVSTQALEVSLQLDFDRGAVEAAPVESVAQRAGRVNRRGLHPEGPVAFHVHRATSPRPYEPQAVDAAWMALTTLTSRGADTLSEQDIDQLLALAYDTDWGRSWAQRALMARDNFTDHFLTFTEPFHDRTEFAHRLDSELDTTEILHQDDINEFQQLHQGRGGDPLLAAGLLIPVRQGQMYALQAVNLGMFDRSLGLFITTAPYSSTKGLQLPSSHSARPQAPETIL